MPRYNKWESGQYVRVLDNATHLTGSVRPGDVGMVRYSSTERHVFVYFPTRLVSAVMAKSELEKTDLAAMRAHRASLPYGRE